MKIKTSSILGVNVSATSYNDTLLQVRKLLQSKQKAYICVAAVHLIMECQQDTNLKKGVNRAKLVTPDGMPLVWLLKLYGHAKVERVYGPTLMRKICSLAQKNKYRIFLLGGHTHQSQQIANQLKKDFPGIKIVGSQDTPNPQQSVYNAQLVQHVNHTRADIVFIGMGCPHQERFMIQNRSILTPTMLIGVGAAFDFLTNRKKQAPEFIQKSGFEWLFRLIQEPRRLWYRYTITNLKFIQLLAIQLINDFVFKHNVKK